MSEANRLTVGQALAWATEELRPTSPTARLDAELLLAYVCGWSRARLLAEMRMPLAEEHETAFRTLVARRAALEPITYLLGVREFFGLEFEVEPGVLVPRPETELLVEAALRWLRDHADAPQPLVADIGTGTGCIAVAVAANAPQARLYAVDLSPDALRVARRNIERHGLTERVLLLEGDLLDALPEPVDLLLSNPPYTILSEIDEGVRLHEPHLALDGGPDGLDVYRRLLAAAPTWVRPGGAVMLEIGVWQAADVRKLALAAFPAAQVMVQQDLAGRDRVVLIEGV